MIIQINTEECEKHTLTPLELAYLYCLNYNLSLDFDLHSLKELGYIDENDELTPLIKSKLFKINDHLLLFVKIFDTYPFKEGTRIFRPKSIDTADGKHCLTKYNRYVRANPEIGERILKGLINEIILRKKGNSMEFFQDIKTWFNQMTWEKYADLDLVTEVVEKTKVI
jgi:hypothetical protein